MRYLIQFSQQHESFWLPELDTLLELNGVDPVAAYDHHVAWAVVSRGHKVRHAECGDRPVAASKRGREGDERVLDGRWYTLGCVALCRLHHAATTAFRARMAQNDSPVNICRVDAV